MNGNKNGKLLPNTDSHNCFACSSQNAHGLKMVFFVSGSSLQSWVTVPDHLCGWNDTVHGGIISTILDEIMGWAGMYFLKKITMTKKITVAFMKASYAGDRLKAVARVVGPNGKREAIIKGYVYNSKDEICAKAEGKFTLISTGAAKRLKVVNDDQIRTFFEPLINS